MNPGTQLGRYTLLGKIATGGMAEVFLARQAGPQGFAKTLVVKRILPHLARDESFIRMFLDEARLAAVINHPNVVSIFELAQDAATNSYYMAMEYIDGCNLKRVIHEAVRAKSRFPTAFCARVIADACAGLEYAHNLKGEDREPLHIVHRDISPENILITYSGLVKVVDFGIAKAASIEGRTQAGQVKGKFGYMPPEQLLGHPLDRRADVWSLGVVLYWMCSGAKPFPGDNEAVIIQKILGSEPEPLDNRVPGISPRLAEIVHLALAKDPNQRYESARALQQDLEAWIAAEGLVASSAALSDYMNSHFPEATDRDRLLVRALQSGELQQGTPSDTELPGVPIKSASHTALSSSSQSLTSEGAMAAALFGRRNMILAGVAAGSVLALASIGVVFFMKPGAPAYPAPPTAPVAAPLPLATPPPAAPAVATPPPAAVAPPPVVAAARPVATPPPAPTQAPTPAPAPTAHRPRPEHHRPAITISTSASSESSEGDEGHIAIRVSPWATVFVDGQRIGTTPLPPVDVPPGSHEVRLVNDALKAERFFTVTVKAGDTANVRAMLGNE